MTSVRLSSEQVTELRELLAALAAAPGTSDDDRYQLRFSRRQVGRRVPAVEALVVAGVLRDAGDRPELPAALQAACDRWSAQLEHLIGTIDGQGAGAATRRRRCSRRTWSREVAKALSAK
jgi:hypothetical protein